MSKKLITLVVAGIAAIALGALLVNSALASQDVGTTSKDKTSIEVRDTSKDNVGTETPSKDWVKDDANAATDASSPDANGTRDDSPDLTSDAAMSNDQSPDAVEVGSTGEANDTPVDDSPDAIDDSPDAASHDASSHDAQNTGARDDNGRSLDKWDR